MRSVDFGIQNYSAADNESGFLERLLLCLKFMDVDTCLELCDT